MKRTCFPPLFKTLFPSLLALGLSTLPLTSSENNNNPDKQYECVKDEEEQTCPDCEEESCDEEEEDSAPSSFNIGPDEDCPEGYTKVEVDNGNGGGGNASLYGLPNPGTTSGRDANEVLARAYLVNGGRGIAGGFQPGYASPASINVYMGRGAEVIRDAETNIRQVKGGKGLLDIITTGPRSMEWRYYQIKDVGSKSGGVYTFKSGSSPLKVIAFEENEAGTAVNKTVTDNRAAYPSIKGVEMTQETSEDGNSIILTKTYKKGEGGQAIPYRKVVTKMTAIAQGAPLEESYLVTAEELGTDGQWHLVERRAGRRAKYLDEKGLVPLYECNAVHEDGSPMNPIATETTYTYYDDILDRSSYGKIRTLRRNDGYWENKYYEHNLSAGVYTEKTESPWLNTAAHEPGESPQGSIRTKVEVSCATDSGIEGITETVDGIVIAKEWTEKTPVDNDKVKEVRHQPHSGGDKVTTTIRYRRAEDIPGYLSGKPIRIEHADGLKEIYSYEAQDDMLVCTHDKGYGNDVVERGLRTVTTTGLVDNKLREEVRYALEESQAHWLSSRTGIVFDNAGNALKWIYDNNPDDYSEIRKDCCNITWQRERDGAEITYAYDAAGRTTAETSRGITYTYEYKGSSYSVYKQLVGSNERYFVSRETKDLTASTTEMVLPAFGGGELVTSHQYNVAQRKTVTTNPTGTNSSEVRFADGQIQSTIEATGITTEYEYAPSSKNGGGWVTSFTQGEIQETQASDLLGNVYLEKSGNGGTIQHQYSSFGKLILTTNPDGVMTLRHEEGATSTICLDKNRNGSIDLDEDSATRETRQFDPAWPEGKGSWKTTREVAYQGEWIITETQWNTEDGTMMRTHARGDSGYHVTSLPPLYQRQNSFMATSSFPAGQQKTIKYKKQNGIVTGLVTVSKDDAGHVISMEETTQDPWGQVLTITDSRTGTTTYGYDSATHLLLSKVTPAGHQSSYLYDRYLRQVEITLPEGSKQYAEYDEHNRMVRQWGSQLYPVRYEYDSHGHKTAMYTYRTPVEDTSNWPEGGETDKTTWVYSPVTGLLTQKLYADGNGTSYTYTLGGKLKTETNARGNVSTCQYDNIGQLLSITVNDNGMTPAQTYVYDQLGNMVEARTQGVVEYTYTYSSEKLKLVKEEIRIPYDGGVLNRQIHRTYDEYARPTGYTLNNGATVEQALVYAYNAAGQVAMVSTDGKEFNYAYQANAPHLISQVISPVHLVTNIWDEKRDELITKSNHWKNKSDNGIISSYTYEVDLLGQRSSVSMTGEAFRGLPANWQWNYDILGQVIKANGQEYVYDQIGNRLETKVDGQLDDTYTVNALNQYSHVSENSLQYDADGNLISGLKESDSLPGRHQLVFTYNAQNRPVRISLGDQTIETNSYDHQGRRVTQGNIITLYDGYNAIAQYASASVPVLKETYAWGLDLLGTFQDAGGVGGLLAVKDYSTQQELVSYPAYDGNGNVTEYLTEESDGGIKAHYEYDAFGNVTRKQETKEYSYQFSTKPFDVSTKTNYYNYRNYDPISGRWINRDPIEEKGGNNLYAFVNNSSINYFDIKGAYITSLQTPAAVELALAGALGVAAAQSFDAQAISSLIKKLNWTAEEMAEEIKRLGGKKKMYLCVATGGMIKLASAPPGTCCDGWLTGTGVGVTEAIAKANAKKNANSNCPRGCQAKHLNPFCTRL